MIMIGSARIDENGKAVGGQPGDQKQKMKPDTVGEVSMQQFYNHSKGWYILRAKDNEIRSQIAHAMKRACNNNKIGYSQSDRYSAVRLGTRTKKKCNCDCSSLVRLCILEASGVDVGDFTTLNEAGTLERSGLFHSRIEYNESNPVPLFNGDILVTRSKGHTAVIVSGANRSKV